MYAPEGKEDDEEVVDRPKALVVASSRPLERGGKHSHERKQHDIAGPPRSSGEIDEKPALKA